MAAPGTKPKKSAPSQTPTISSSQITRDDFLRGLAARPKLALADWKRLRQRNEDTVVTMYMMANYGYEFVQHFLQVARGNRPSDQIDRISNHPMMPKSLAAQGYKRLGVGFGGVQIWVHASGHEYWVFPPSRWSDDPFVEILQRDANKLVEFKEDEFPRMLKTLDGMTGMDMYEFDFKFLKRSLDDFERTLASVKLNIPELNDGSTEAQELAELRRKVETLEDWLKNQAPVELSQRAPLITP